VISHQRRFLTKMGKGTRDHKFYPRLADALLSVQAIDFTLPRAKPTFFEEFLEEPNPLTELPFFKETDIGRDKRHFNITP
jgi:hypothetical protein